MPASITSSGPGTRWASPRWICWHCAPAGRSRPRPGAVPESHEQILAVLELCSQRHVAVIPFGGGTSVVGGLAPEVDRFAGSVSLDLRRLNALRELDEQSRMATFGPGVRGGAAEALLGRRGYTLGHFPQSLEYATLGGFAAGRSSGQASAGYGRFDELVMALRVATPAGTLTLGRAPKSAAGPDLRQLILGSEGAFGVLTELTVSVRPAPEQRIYEGWRLPDFAAGLATVQRLAQDGLPPTVLRLSDEAETALGRAGAEPTGPVSADGCLAIVGWEGAYDELRARREASTRLLRAAGATEVGGAGDAWPAIATPARTYVTRCSTPGRWWKRSRRPPSGPCCGRCMRP